MGKFGFISLAFLAFQALLVNGQNSPDAAEGTTGAEGAEDPVEVAKLDLIVLTKFPNAEVFGVKLVNGQPTESIIEFQNNEPEDLAINLIGGSLWTLDSPSGPAKNIRNLTTVPVNVNIASGSQVSLPYSFTTEMHPQDLRLSLAAIVADGKGNMVPVNAFNGTVSVVEADTSIFDPQILFLYFFLLACSTGAVYFFYTLWVAPYFPQKRKGGKGSDRSKKAAGGPSSADSTEHAPAGADVTPSGKTYDSEWIPAHHIQRPEARKVKSGGGRFKTRT